MELRVEIVFAERVISVRSDLPKNTAPYASISCQVTVYVDLLSIKWQQ